MSANSQPNQSETNDSHVIGQNLLISASLVPFSVEFQ